MMVIAATYPVLKIGTVISMLPLKKLWLREINLPKVHS